MKCEVRSPKCERVVKCEVRSAKCEVRSADIARAKGSALCTSNFALVVSVLAPGAFAAHSQTLKGAFTNDSLIGVAINQRQFTGQDTNGVGVIVGQFNSITPENVLKWEAVHPRAGTNGYNFEPA